MLHSIRPGRPEDADICADIFNAWVDAQDWMPRVHSKKGVRAFYRTVVFAEWHVWVAGDPISGFLAMDQSEEMVMALFVATPGQGIGKALLDHAKAGRDRLRLLTFVANTGARRFYAREGFVEVSRTPGDNEEGLPDVMLRWEAPR